MVGEKKKEMVEFLVGRNKTPPVICNVTLTFDSLNPAG